MTTLLPRSAGDLAIAPVLINLEHNLERLRTATDLVLDLALDLNDVEDLYRTPESRAQRLARSVTRNVNLHGLSVEPAPDLSGITVSHGEYRVSLMFGRRLATYVERGAGQELAGDLAAGA